MSAELGTSHFRQSMTWLHTWAGLVLGWLLYFMFLTGTLGYFDDEIDRWMQPEVPGVKASYSQADLTKIAEQYLQNHAVAASFVRIEYPDSRTPFLVVRWTEPAAPEKDGRAKRVKRYLNPETGEAIEPRETAGGRTLYRLHYALHYMPRSIAYLITSLAAFFMLLALITGIVIHRRIFADMFLFRPGKKQRSWLDMHNLMSVLPLPFHLMITYSGLVFLMFTSMPWVMTASYEDEDDFFDLVFSQPLPEASGVSEASMSFSEILPLVEAQWPNEPLSHIEIRHPDDKNAFVRAFKSDYEGIDGREELRLSALTGEPLSLAVEHEHQQEQGKGAINLYFLLTNLHEGLFANTALRWLYFISGLLGTGMVATGMILWAKMRRQKVNKRSPASKGLVLVEKLNAGAIAGLLVAIAVYFMANRLLPVAMDNRASFEVDALFIALACCLVYPVFRSATKAWVELLILAGVLYSVLPPLSWVLTERTLLDSWLNNDWVMLSVDLSFIFVGLVLMGAALKIRRLNAPLYKPSDKILPKPVIANKGVEAASSLSVQEGAK